MTDKLEDKKVHKLTAVADLTQKETHEQMILRHLKETRDELKHSSPDVLIVVGLKDDGILYQILTAGSIAEVVGALTIAKHYLMTESGFEE